MNLAARQLHGEASTHGAMLLSDLHVRTNAKNEIVTARSEMSVLIAYLILLTRQPRCYPQEFLTSENSSGLLQSSRQRRMAFGSSDSDAW